MVSSGANVIIWCYYVMLSSGMITHPFFIFPENFTHSFVCCFLRVVKIMQIPNPVVLKLSDFSACLNSITDSSAVFKLIQNHFQVQIISLFGKSCYQGWALGASSTIDTDSLIVLFPWFDIDFQADLICATVLLKTWLQKNVISVRTEQTVTTYSFSKSVNITLNKDAIKFLFYHALWWEKGGEQRVLKEFQMTRLSQCRLICSSTTVHIPSHQQVVSFAVFLCVAGRAY